MVINHLLTGMILQVPLEDTPDVSPTVYAGIPNSLFFVGGLGKFGVSFQGMWAKSLAIDFFVGDISGKEQKQLLPRNLTWNLKMLVSKRKDFFSRDFFSGSM